MRKAIERSMKERNDIVANNLPLVKFAIRKLRNVPIVRLIEYDDAFQIGCLAMMDSAKSWREDGGASFSSYAFRMIAMRIFAEAKKIAKAMEDAVAYNSSARTKPAMASNGINAVDDRDQIRHLSGKWRPAEKRVMSMIFWHGINMVDVGKIIGMCPQGVQCIRNRAIEKARKMASGKEN